MLKIKLPDDLALKTVFECASNSGYEARLVGGFVRDSLLGTPVGDMDIAISCPPEITTEIFESSGYKVIPTGFDYGTVTVIIDGQSFEVTSLRADVETDGRRAVVAYTDDWTVDACRRDFTINALYAGVDGTVYDFVGGVSDLELKCLRFVGDAHIRVAEDALRILRYYRFMVQLGFSPVNNDSARACKEGAVLLKKISFERIGMEMKKMFSCPINPSSVLQEMQKAGVLACIVSFAVKIDFRFMKPPISDGTKALLKCIALTNGEYEKLQMISSLWKFSNADAKYMRDVLTVYNDRAFVPNLCHKFAYYYGIEVVVGASDLKQAIFGDAFARTAEILQKWERPKFPLTGKDMQLLGMEPSPAMGAMLKATEMWWVDNAFKPRMQDCLIFAKQRMNVKR